MIYPLVEESEKVDLRAATAMADHLQAEVFPEYRVALLHGRLKQDEKDRVMAAFARGDVHVLVSTTVVEVGVDVPNATVMIVEHAERFGLSQLHQLRGRVGRGAHASTCVLLYQHPLSEPGRARLDALVETTDGFVIAERDLALRGPGDFFGTRQSGLPTLRVGDLLRDHALMEDARREAVAWLDADAGAQSLVRVPLGQLGGAVRPRRRWVAATVEPMRIRSAGIIASKGPPADRRRAATGVRPTSDRLRETLFNVLGPSRRRRARAGRFAGTGALGLEALSRGAAHVTFVERDPRALARARGEHRHLRRRRTRVLSSAAISCACAGAPGRPFDLVLLDPPYDIDDLDAVLDGRRRRSRRRARSSSSTAGGARRRKRRTARRARASSLAGDSALSFYATSDWSLTRRTDGRDPASPSIPDRSIR